MLVLQVFQQILYMCFMGRLSHLETFFFSLCQKFSFMFDDPQIDLRKHESQNFDPA